MTKAKKHTIKIIGDSNGKITDQGICGVPEYIDYGYERELSLGYAIRLFSETPFKNFLIGNTRSNGTSEIIDVPFYQVVGEIYEFLKSGKFPGYEAFKLSQQVPVKE